MVTLISAPIGSAVTIAKIDAEDTVKRRLKDLGIIAGQSVTPIYGTMGSTVLRVKDSRLAINNGLARKIYVHRH